MRCVYGNRKMGPTSIPGQVMTPGNDNPNTPSKKIDWLGVFIIALFCVIPGGLILAWYLEEWWPVCISVVAFIIFYAG